GAERVAARKAVRVRQGPEEWYRPYPVEQQFQRGIQNDGSDHPYRQPRGGARPFCEEKPSATNCEKREEYVGRPQEGDALHPFCEARRGILVNERPYRKIEMVRFTLENFFGQPGKENQRQ